MFPSWSLMNTCSRLAKVPLLSCSLATGLTAMFEPGPSGQLALGGPSWADEQAAGAAIADVAVVDAARAVDWKKSVVLEPTRLTQHGQWNWYTVPVPDWSSPRRCRRLRSRPAEVALVNTLARSRGAVVLAMP